MYLNSSAVIDFIVNVHVMVAPVRFDYAAVQNAFIIDFPKETCTNRLFCRTFFFLIHFWLKTTTYICQAQENNCSISLIIIGLNDFRYLIFNRQILELFEFFNENNYQIDLIMY